ncbi:hypothetical protein ACHHYP_08603 [Achlya hypogyna]|uniref:Uncharacterized protein n=1 Tax=Achlya hypogyna TaxID=1202772 RepID=A0A1V9ZKF6_ACHHY|nr:hypothetical protein ACHHYP_08603 [Achlya hypogyna]
MPVLLRRNAPRPSVEELVDPVSSRDLLQTKPDLRRGSVPVMPSTGESFFRKGRGRNSEGNFLNNNVFLEPTAGVCPGHCTSTDCICDEPPSPTEAPAAQEKTRPSTYSMIVNNPMMVNRVAHELSLLPKTYLRLALERVVSSASRSISSIRRKPKKTADKEAASPVVPPSSGATSPTESDRNSTQA